MINLSNKTELEYYFADHFDTVLFPVLADLYYQEEDFSRALKVCEIGLGYHPHHVDGLYIQAKVLTALNRLEEAEKSLLALQEAGPFHARGMDLLVDVQRRLRRSPAARLKTWKVIHKHNPNHPRAATNIRRLKKQVAAGPQPASRKASSSRKTSPSLAEPPTPEPFKEAAASVTAIREEISEAKPEEREAPPSFQATKTADEIDIPEDIFDQPDVSPEEEPESEAEEEPEPIIAEDTDISQIEVEPSTTAVEPDTVEEPLVTESPKEFEVEPPVEESEPETEEEPELPSDAPSAVSEIEAESATQVEADVEEEVTTPEPLEELVIEPPVEEPESEAEEEPEPIIAEDTDISQIEVKPSTTAVEPDTVEEPLVTESPEEFAIEPPVEETEPETEEEPELVIPEDTDTTQLEPEVPTQKEPDTETTAQEIQPEPLVEEEETITEQPELDDPVARFLAQGLESMETVEEPSPSEPSEEPEASTDLKFADEPSMEEEEMAVEEIEPGDSDSAEASVDEMEAKPRTGDEEKINPPLLDPERAPHVFLEKPEKPDKSQAAETKPLNINPRMATFTMVSILSKQGLYHQALEVLDVLENKGEDSYRIMMERKRIQQAMEQDEDA